MKMILGALGGAALLIGTLASASDHDDGPSAVEDLSADLTDVFAWWSDDQESLNLVLGVRPGAENGDWFSPDVEYVFHLSGHEAPGTASETELDLSCVFDSANLVECSLAGEAIIKGDPTQVLKSEDGAIRLTAGLRRDPAHWNREGYHATIQAIHDGIFGGEITFDYDESGCPLLGEDVQDMIRETISLGPDRSEPSNQYEGQNILALEVQLSTEWLPSDSKALGVWAATYHREAE